MFKRLAFGLIILSGLLLISCDSDDINNGGGDNNSGDLSKNYWERSALNHMQLKGKVKSIRETTEHQEGKYEETYFNEHGWITKFRSNYLEGEIRETVLRYNDEGEMISDGYANYEYSNHGRYIPGTFFHMQNEPLYKNLSKVSTEGYTVQYEFRGNFLYVIADNEDEDIVVEYTGPYPTKMGDVNDTSNEWGEFMNASYQENGMFDVYEEGYYGTGDNWHLDSRKTFYKKDNEYLLREKQIYSISWLDSKYDHTSEMFYTYNSHKDLIKYQEFSEDELSETITYDYEYDSLNNWVKKTETYTWAEREMVYVYFREIEYYD